MSFRALAEKQFGCPLHLLDAVLRETYLVQLRAFIARYAEDTHFKVVGYENKVLYVICQEDGCDEAPPFEITNGVSNELSFDNYKKHIATHPTHSAMRDVRVKGRNVEVGAMALVHAAPASLKREYSATSTAKETSSFPSVATFSGLKGYFPGGIPAAFSGLKGYLPAGLSGNLGQIVGSSVTLSAQPHKKPRMLPSDPAPSVSGSQNVDDPVEVARQALKLRDDARIPGMTIPLMPHQIIGVAWMVHQEQSSMRGGCLADEMGLGKTVQTIAVTMANRPQEHARTKTTLVIAPLSLLHQWKDEISEKTGGQFSVLMYHGRSKPNDVEGILAYDFVLVTLATLIHEWIDPQEQERIEKAGKGKAKELRQGALFDVAWFRVVLDEAHMSTKSSRAVTHLKTTYRWALTGTPIINSLNDAYGIFRFLQLHPWHEWKHYDANIARLERQNPQLATQRLHSVFSMMQLRRLTTSTLNGMPLINIPPRSVAVKKLDFNEEERELYRTIERRQQIEFDKLLRAGTVLKNYNHILTMILRLRQLCLHTDLIEDKILASADSRMDGVAHRNRRELLRAESLAGATFVARVKDQRSRVARDYLAAEEAEVDAGDLAIEECVICLDSPTDAVVTQCGHIFCRPCLMAVFTSQNHADAHSCNCPICRNVVTKEMLFSLSAFEPVIGVGDHSALIPSSKMTYMLDTIKDWNKNFPQEKVLVISQWTSCLNIISACLNQDGIEHVQYRGDMTLDQRQSAIKLFQSPNGAMLMLMSRACGGVGLNLTRGNRVICMDLAWSEAVENQAWSRVHRIGQQRDVVIERLIIRDTIEERLLALQTRKRLLADGSLEDGASLRTEQGLSELELAALFNI